MNKLNVSQRQSEFNDSEELRVLQFHLRPTAGRLKRGHSWVQNSVQIKPNQEEKKVSCTYVCEAVETSKEFIQHSYELLRRERRGEVCEAFNICEKNAE